MAPGMDAARSPGGARRPRALSCVVRRFGPAREVVELEEAEIPPPAAHEVVVRLERSAINPSDLVTVSGAYPSRTPLPFRPGYEGVGTVVEAGSAVEGLAPGTRVLPIGAPGAWSTHKTAQARWCFPVPERLSLDQAATMYVNPCTAWLMLHERAEIRPGRRVVVSAAASAIGLMLVRLLNRSGVAPVVTVARAASAGRLEGLEVSSVLRSGSPTFEAELLDATGGGQADLVLDAVGGAAGLALSRALKPGGRFVHYGLLSGVPLPPEAWRRDPAIAFELFSLRTWIHARPRRDIKALLERVGALAIEGTLSSEVEAVYDLPEIGAALRHAESDRRRGKVLLRP